MVSVQRSTPQYSYWLSILDAEERALASLLSLAERRQQSEPFDRPEQLALLGSSVRPEPFALSEQPVSLARFGRP